MLKSIHMPRGMSLIELMIGITILAFLLLLGVPSFSNFLENTRIRNAAEITIAGINLARAEAIRRNAAVRFQLVTDLTSGCALSSTSLNWVVSLANPAGLCDVAPSETTAPQIVQKQSGREGMRNATVTATGGNTIVFNGLGRVTGASITQLDFSNVSGTCTHLDAANGTMRCLRIQLSTGGQSKLCDPKVTAATDPRYCS